MGKITAFKVLVDGIPITFEVDTENGTCTFEAQRDELLDDECDKGTSMKLRIFDFVGDETADKTVRFATSNTDEMSFSDHNGAIYTPLTGIRVDATANWRGNKGLWELIVVVGDE